MVLPVSGRAGDLFMEGRGSLVEVFASYLPRRLKFFLMRFFGPRVMIGEK